MTLVWQQKWKHRCVVAASLGMGAQAGRCNVPARRPERLARLLGSRLVEIESLDERRAVPRFNEGDQVVGKEDHL